MGGIGWNVGGCACTQNGCLTAEGYLDLSVEHNERLFVVVAMRAGPAARRDVHVDHAKPVVGVVPGDRDGVGVPDQTYMGSFPSSLAGSANWRVRLRSSAGMGGYCNFLSIMLLSPWLVISVFAGVIA